MPPSSPASALPGDGQQLPTVILVLGMAGSGKTTFLQRLNAHLRSQKTTPYILNLDPAVIHLPFDPNIDIRDTIDYKKVMHTYELGPNGAIVTGLNLFATKFDQVLDFLKKRIGKDDYILIDTPGQIEVFTWSASGSIMTDALAAVFPTVIAYVVDTPRSAKPVTFMSNMLYACSILYKTKLPFVVVFNKTDVRSHRFAVSWMTDFESLQDSITTGRLPTFLEDNDEPDQEGGDNRASELDEDQDQDSYMTTFVHSMSLVLEEFYNNLECVGVSSATGLGCDEFFEGVQKARSRYFAEYIPELKRVMAERMAGSKRKQQESLTRLVKDLSLEDKTTAHGQSGGKGGGGVPAFGGTVVVSGQKGASEGACVDSSSEHGEEPLFHDGNNSDADVEGRTSAYFREEVERNQGFRLSQAGAELRSLQQGAGNRNEGG